MRHASLFNGIGATLLAAEWMGWENIFLCEINDWCNKKMKNHFPDCIQHTDITKTDFKKYAGRIDILTGGFPCQTFSIAGKGTLDLTLWKEMYRAIKEIKPTYIMAENVPGIVSRKRGMAFDIVCSDMENFGYAVTPINIPIAGRGAPHERERIWFVAYSDSIRRENEQEEKRQIIYNEEWNSKTSEQSGNVKQCRISESDSNITNTNSIGELQSQRGEQIKRERISNDIVNPSNSKSILAQGQQLRQGEIQSGGSDRRIPEQPITDTISERSQGQGKYRGQMHSEQNGERKINRTFNEDQFKESWTEVALRLCGMDDGVSERVAEIDRVEKITAYGNSMSPLVVYQIFKAIKATL